VQSVKWNELQDYSFEKYQKEFDKFYQPSDVLIRRWIFENNLVDILKHNSDPTKTWKKGVNHYTDWTLGEFKQLLGVRKELLYRTKRNSIKSPTINVADLPQNVDWRDKRIISPVKDQGRCGSCWTFATAELTESYWALSTGELSVLSEQQILDCTPNPQHCGGTGGCDGGTAELAWDRISAMGGLSSEWTYPYQSYLGTAYQCRFSTFGPAVANVTQYINLPPNEQDPILDHLANKGPLAISVDASAWSPYESGVFDGCNQTDPDLDHAVQLVGYGTDPNLGDYWLVRNSWSPNWGEKGYIRLKRTHEITCGIDTNPSDGDGCSGGPPTVNVCGTCGILYDGVYPVVGSHR